MRERGGDWLELANALSPLALHASARVRRSVADAADLFSDSLFDHVAGSLARDGDPYVCKAIQRAAERKAEQRKAGKRQTAEERVLEGLFDEVEEIDERARPLAERAAKRNAELFVRKLHHEIVKVVVPLEMTLARIKLHAEGRAQAGPRSIGVEVADAEERVRYLAAMLDRANEATKTVKPRRKEERVRQLVEAARSQLEDRLEPARRARLRVTLDVDDQLRANLDRAEMLRALQNLLQNAAEAYPEGAERIAIGVSARTLRLGTELEIIVTDEGVGMSDAQRSKLFMPLESTKGRGSGLGMLTVRRVVEDVHGGRLEIESEQGKGTKVRIVVSITG